MSSIKELYRLPADRFWIDLFVKANSEQFCIKTTSTCTYVVDKDDKSKSERKKLRDFSKHINSDYQRFIEEIVKYTHEIEEKLLEDDVYIKNATKEERLPGVYRDKLGIKPAKHVKATDFYNKVNTTEEIDENNIVIKGEDLLLEDEITNINMLDFANIEGFSQVQDQEQIQTQEQVQEPQAKRQETSFDILTSAIRNNRIDIEELETKIFSAKEDMQAKIKAIEEEFATRTSEINVKLVAVKDEYCENKKRLIAELN